MIEIRKTAIAFEEEELLDLLLKHEIYKEVQRGFAPLLGVWGHPPVPTSTKIGGQRGLKVIK